MPGSFITTEAEWDAFRTELRLNGRDATKLHSEADRWLETSPVSVADKQSSDRDPCDYVSQAPYWWADPEKENGLPYIRRDGEENPEIHRSDRSRLEAFRDAISCLTLQARASGSLEYAEQAGRFLRRWFLDPGFAMTPHMRYAQFIPGICDGRAIGLIESSIFCFVLDEVTHLPFCESWTPQDLQRLKEWFSAYLDWFLGSEHGIQESTQHNNHGTWYDAQVVCFTQFCGRQDEAIRWLEQHVLQRMESQIAPDGSQPHELARTLSLTYCTFNLTALAVMARVADRVSPDRWRARLLEALRPALHWMLPYYLDRREWGWQQREPFKKASAAYLLNLAAGVDQDTEISQAADQLALHAWSRISVWGGNLRSYDRSVAGSILRPSDKPGPQH